MTEATRKPTPSANRITPTTVNASLHIVADFAGRDAEADADRGEDDAGHHRPEDRADRRGEAGRFRFGFGGAASRKRRPAGLWM